jgi:hypothetical protein
MVPPTACIIATSGVRKLHISNFSYKTTAFNEGVKKTLMECYSLIVIDRDGYKCGNCVEKELDDIFISTAPYSDPKRYQEIMDKRRREEDKRRKVAEIKALVERANNSNNKKPAGRLVR